MDFRSANKSDLPQLKAMYAKIIDHMNQTGVEIWDEIYPCAFFAEDIEAGRLYVLEENGVIAAAFALCDSNGGEPYVNWEDGQAKAWYIDRLGVNVGYLRKGIGGLALSEAIGLAREKDIAYLRLFVVDINKPAIRLYEKSGFKKAGGTYDEIIDDDLILHEWGFEIKTAR